MDHDEMRKAMKRATEEIPTHGDGRFVLWQADCREALARLDDNSVDAIVTDPPYELGFMGKTWDASGIAYDVEMWREALRVLKPGGHLLAFGGSRTYHRLACAVEDAEFEIRDQIMWVYGSGFPKSLDVSKAIDKMDARDEQEARRYRFTAWVRSTGITAKQIDEATGTNMGGHYTTNASQPAIMTREHLEACRHLLGDIPEWVEREADIRSVESRNFAAREVVGTETRYNEPSGIVNVGQGERTLIERNITTPATDAAKQWQGWGTALKPSHEPIVVARKPLEGTVAANVLKWGTGALNIDGTRVASGDSFGGGAKATSGFVNGYEHDGWQAGSELGRWPANFIHDGSDEVVALFPDTKAGVAVRRNVAGKDTSGFIGRHPDSAARFFYCAKASKAERNAGLGHLEERDVHRYGAGIGEGKDPTAPTADRNTHPTVKPIALMRYLIRLVTPPGGVVLDPFAGSGTTMVAALMEGVTPWGCEMTEDYIPIIVGRIQWALDEVDSRIAGTL